jgi:PAS domain S-box-containing protein
LILALSGRFDDKDKRTVSNLVAQSRGEAPSTADRGIAVAIDMLPVAALIYDRDDGTIRHANPLFESMVGADDSCVGRQILDFYSDSEEHLEFITRLLDEDVVNGRQITGTVRNGTEMWFDTSSRWVTYSEKPAVLTLFTNIDAEKRAQLASKVEQAQTSALAEISAIIASQRPGNEVFTRVANVAKRLVPFNRIGIALFDPDDETFTLKFVRGIEVEGREEGNKLLIKETLNSYVVKSRKSLVIDDIESTTIPIDIPGIEANQKAGIRSLITVPMIADDRVVGTISLRSKSTGTYDRGSVNVIERIGSLLAPALEQSRLYQNLEREAHERKIIAEIGQVISSSPDVNKVYSRFTRLVQQILPADRLVVTILEESSEKFLILHRSGITATDRAQGQRIQSAGSLIPLVMKTRKPAIFRPTDATQVSREFSNLTSVYEAGLRSFLSIPLFVGDRIVGTLQAFSVEEGDYTQRHIELAESIASQIAGAIASSLLREAEQQTAAENAALAELGRIITSATDVSPIFERFGQLVGEILPLSRLVVSLIGSDAGTSTA